MKLYKELKYGSFEEAKISQKKYKKTYGYIPEIFKIRKNPTDKWKFVIIKPYGIKRV